MRRGTMRRGVYVVGGRVGDDAKGGIRISVFRRTGPDPGAVLDGIGPGPRSGEVPLERARPRSGIGRFLHSATDTGDLE